MSRNGSQFNKLAIFLCLAALAGSGIAAQTPAPEPETNQPPKTAVKPARQNHVRVTPTPVVKAPPRVPGRPSPRSFPRPPMHDGINSERALAVDPNVNIKLPCISRARVSINGWDRNEIRVFVKNGGKVGFRVHEKDPKSGKPIWVLITGQTGELARSPLSECISGEAIEIDVPVNASLSILGRETETKIDSVKKINIKNLGGNVALRNISGGITASTYEGDVAVENSGGQISLETSAGNIVAYEVAPGQIGDTFKAKTSKGAITLQKVDHRQIDANSVSGSLLFDGKFLSGGLYSFRTTDGSIKLAIPADSSCKLIASYGFGSFNSVYPVKVLAVNKSPGGRSLVANIGAGDATVNVTTSSGSISISERQMIP